MKCPPSRFRLYMMWRALGFTPEQAHALADAGVPLSFVRADVLLGGAR